MPFSLIEGSLVSPYRLAFFITLLVSLNGHILLLFQYHFFISNGVLSLNLGVFQYFLTEIQLPIF